MSTPYESDIAGQPDALRSFAATPQRVDVPDLAGLERIVLTGMGTSHYAGWPVWRALVRAGLPAWWIDTAQLLDAPELVTGRTLLWIASQSGRSGEAVALLERLSGACRPASGGLRSQGGRPSLLAVTNDPASPLAAAADRTVLLHCGTEATVSTKSYLNTLAAQELIVATAPGGGGRRVRAGIAALAGELQSWLALPGPLDGAADAACATGRVALIGAGDQIATALTGALVAKEAAKVPAQGYGVGEFRHGPMELAGPGLTAILIDDPSSTANDLPRLAVDLAGTGARVLLCPSPPQAKRAVPDATGRGLCRAGGSGGGCGATVLPRLRSLLYATVAVQRFTVALARANRVVPGAFRYGRKVTEVR